MNAFRHALVAFVCAMVLLTGAAWSQCTSVFVAHGSGGSHMHSDGQIWEVETVVWDVTGTPVVHPGAPETIAQMVYTSSNTPPPCQPRSGVFSHTFLYQHSYSVGGVTTITAGMSAAVGNLVGQVSASASASVSYNNTTSNSNTVTFAVQENYTIPICHRVDISGITDRLSASGSLSYTELQIICRRYINNGSDVIRIPTTCGSRTIGAQATGWTQTSVTVVNTRIPGCDCNDDDGSGPGGGGGGGGGDGGGDGGGGGGGDGDCDELIGPIDIIGPGELIGGLIIIGEDTMDLLPKPPCIPDGNWMIMVVEGSMLEVKLEVKYE